jgi:ubiquinone biosynthesis monooxygenase Coq7
MSDAAPRRPPYLPGDPPPAAEIARMIRVDHAGEYGAVRIYDGQLAVIGRGRARDEIRRMAEQEKRHLAAFDEMMRRRNVRPTALQPLWHLAGFALGAGTALLGERAAMACTVAVEEVIDEHYARQAERLGSADPALDETVRSFRADELRHRAVALEHGATEAVGYDLIAGAIKAGSRLAIWLSTRI